MVRSIRDSVKNKLICNDLQIKLVNIARCTLIFCYTYIRCDTRSEVCICPTTPGAGFDIRSILKRSSVYLNSEVSFFSTGFRIKARLWLNSLPDYLTIVGRWEDEQNSHPTQVKCKQPRPGFDLGSTIAFPTMITVTLQDRKYEAIVRINSAIQYLLV